MSACHLNDDSHYTALRDRGNPSDTRRIKESMYSHVRRFKLQAQNFFARPSSCSAWPLLGKAGGRIMKRRLIMLFCNGPLDVNPFRADPVAGFSLLSGVGAKPPPDGV